MSKQSKINEDNEQLMDYVQDLEHYPIQTKTTWMVFLKHKLLGNFRRICRNVFCLRNFLNLLVIGIWKKNDMECK